MDQFVGQKIQVFWLKFGHNDCSVKKLTSKKKIYERNTEKPCFFWNQWNSETNEIFIIKEEIAIIEKRHLMIQTILILDIWGSS